MFNDLSCILRFYSNPVSCTDPGGDRLKSFAKLLILIIATINANMAFSANHAQIKDWNSELPLAEQNVIKILDAEAAYFSFETDETTCGGEVSNIQLLNYDIIDAETASPHHEITIRFQLSKAENYCASTSNATCDTQIHIDATGSVKMSDWACN